MPEPHVSDRLGMMSRCFHGALDAGAVVAEFLSMQRQRSIYEDASAYRHAREAGRCGNWALDHLDALIAQELSAQHQIALSYEAQVEQQAQQIWALRAEQARLRAENMRLRVALSALVSEAQDWVEERVIDDDEPSVLIDAIQLLGSLAPST